MVEGLAGSLPEFPNESLQDVAGGLDNAIPDGPPSYVATRLGNAMPSSLPNEDNMDIAGGLLAAVPDMPDESFADTTTGLANAIANGGSARVNDGPPGWPEI